MYVRCRPMAAGVERATNLSGATTGPDGKAEYVVCVERRTLVAGAVVVRAAGPKEAQRLTVTETALAAATWAEPEVHIAADWTQQKGGPATAPV